MADSQQEGAPANNPPADGPSEDGTKKSKKPKMTDQAIDALLELNPSLKGDLAGLPADKRKEMLKKMDLSELLTGLTMNKSNQKDMASHKFWQTQPVPRFEDKASKEAQPDGPIREVIPEQIPKQPAPLPEGYEWVELDLTSETELEECYKLLTNHYVEDDNAMFRLNYSQSFLDWALKAPDWKKSWHIGVRAKGKSRLLVGTIFGIPTKVRVRDKFIDLVEINLLCIHKKLRSKRLAPVMIKEVTRRCHLDGIYQAVYTAGVVLPTPVATCRYFHRPLDWLKLYEVGFSPLPPNSTKARMISKNQLPPKTSIKGWRQMQNKDIDAVHDLLGRYLKRYQLAQEFTRAEIEHWFVDKTDTSDERVTWSFVVEDSNGKITDFTSFYCLDSLVIGATSERHSKVKAAYLFYYASEEAFVDHEKGLRDRLRALMSDLLVEAKSARFDVFNALTLQDNPLFLEHAKFGPGDGQLHYYLYNWRTAPISGGLDKKNMPDEKLAKGIGMVLL